MFSQKVFARLLGLALVAAATNARAQVVYAVDDGNYATTTDALRRVALNGSGDAALATAFANAAGIVAIDAANGLPSWPTAAPPPVRSWP